MSCEFTQRLAELLRKVQPGVDESVVDGFERAVLHEFGGSRIYVKKLNFDREQIKKEFNGVNHKDLSTMFGPSVATIRRIVDT